MDTKLGKIDLATETKDLLNVSTITNPIHSTSFYDILQVDKPTKNFTQVKQFQKYIKNKKSRSDHIERLQFFFDELKGKNLKTFLKLRIPDKSEILLDLEANSLNDK